MQERLRALGARVVMTRTSNREDRWGPCVDVRGRAEPVRVVALPFYRRPDPAAPRTEEKP